MVTRRWFYLIPAEGEPVKLVHKIEAGPSRFTLPGKQISVLRVAGVIRSHSRSILAKLSRHGDAVFAQQQRLHDFPRRWRHDRLDCAGSEKTL
jgi:hypothetical protein